MIRKRRRTRTTHRVETPHDSLKGYSPMTEVGKRTTCETCHEVKGKEVHCRQWGMAKLNSITSKERKMKSTWKSKQQVVVVLFVLREKNKIYIQELGTHLYVKLVHDNLSVLSLGRLCDALGYSYSFKPRESTQKEARRLWYLS